MHQHKTYMYINFQKNRVSRSVKTAHTNLFAKICKLHKFAIRISKNHAFRTCTTSSRTFMPILRSIGLLDNELPRKEIISTDDGRTDNRYFFRKRKKILKMTNTSTNFPSQDTHICYTVYTGVYNLHMHRYYVYTLVTPII